MHGFIVSEIKKYAIEKLGTQSWLDVLKEADAGAGDFVNYREYPDEQVVALVVAASKLTGLEVGAILEDFGIFLAADLLKIYQPLVHPDWRTLDFLENAEGTIHKVVRSRNRQAKPPALTFRRLGPGELELLYSSERKMCSLAKGIATGVANHYGEEMEMEETNCMHRGDEQCRFVIRIGAASA